MASKNDISSIQALRLLFENPEVVKCIDVRSIGEFSQGNIPYFVNIPILSNEERHLVGICYKEQGQAAAIALGHQLVDPHRDNVVSSWRETLQNAEHALLCCWRGGLRSRTAQEWLQNSGLQTKQIVGGYKSLRRELMKTFEALPNLFVISGPTGSGKTRLLRSCLQPHIDLEKLANHRGSAFGDFFSAQPAQASFENALAFHMARERAHHFLAEDESVMIGKLHLPIPLLRKMGESELIKIHENLDSRVAAIYEEYVKEPMATGITSAKLQGKFQENISKIERRLGGLLTTKIRQTIRDAFLFNDPQLHALWIRDLLENYYDKAYAYSFQKLSRKIVFEGDWNECLHWIQKRFA